MRLTHNRVRTRAGCCRTKSMSKNVHYSCEHMFGQRNKIASDSRERKAFKNSIISYDDVIISLL